MGPEGLMTANMPDKRERWDRGFQHPGGRAQVTLDGRHSAESTHGWLKTTRGSGETISRTV